MMLAAARGLFVACLLGGFGSLLFALLVAPRALAEASAEAAMLARSRLRGLAMWQLGGALVLLAAWVLAQSADMAEARTLPAVLEAVPTVLARTSFGHAVLAQAALLLAAAWALAVRRLWPATVLSGAATLLQTLHLHAWAMEAGSMPAGGMQAGTMQAGAGLVLASGAHLLAAGGWLGGLAPLLLMVGTQPARVGAAAARWFSPLGKLCVWVIVVSSGWQFWRLIGGLRALTGTAYGRVAVLKLVLFAVLSGFAAVNRYRLAPALLSVRAETARRGLVRSIAVQGCFGLAVVFAAVALSRLPPPMHAAR